MRISSDKWLDICMKKYEVIIIYLSTGYIHIEFYLLIDNQFHMFHHPPCHHCCCAHQYCDHPSQRQATLMKTRWVSLCICICTTCFPCMVKGHKRLYMPFHMYTFSTFLIYKSTLLNCIHMNKFQTLQYCYRAVMDFGKLQ